MRIGKVATNRWREGDVHDRPMSQGDGESHEDRCLRSDENNLGRAMKCRDDQNGEQDGPGKNHQQVLINGVGDVLQYLGEASICDGVRVSEFRGPVIDDVLKMAEQGREILPISGHREGL